MNQDASTSLIGLLVGLGVSLGHVKVSGLLFNVDTFANSTCSFVLFFVFAAIVLYKLFSGYLWQVCVRAYGLGCGMGLAYILINSGYSFSLVGWYLLALGFFHWSEFMVTAIANPENVSLDSYILDHSMEYHIAAVASCIEFFVEWYFFPEWKQPGYISVIGCIIVVGGESLRKIAMITAQSNFNHYVQFQRRSEHELVTSGVYALFRHPAYVGWFYWSIGTQCMSCNPICTIAYAIVSWRFFNERIHFEEITLLSFFGEDYKKYQDRVGTGLPFIYGYKQVK